MSAPMELIKRLREGAVYGDPRNIGSSGEYDEAATDALLNEAATEIENLRAALTESVMLMTKYAREAGEATGKLEGSEAAGAVSAWRDHAESLERVLATYACQCTDLCASDFVSGSTCGLRARVAVERGIKLRVGKHFPILMAGQDLNEALYSGQTAPFPGADEPFRDRSGYSPATAPCPFCGGEAVFNDHRPRGSCYYNCGLCGAEAGGVHDDEKAALADWNARK